MEPDIEVDKWIHLGRSALLRADARGAIDPLRRALSLDPENAIAHLLLAQALLRLKRPEAARVEADAALLGDPESSDVHVTLGDVLFMLRNVGEAQRHYEAAREFSPQAPAPLRGLAAVEGFYDRDERQRELLEEALRLDPDNLYTLVDLAEAHLKRGRYAEAALHVDTALELEPEHRGALVAKGYVLLSRGEIAQAREHVVWALRSDPTDLAAIHLLAAVKARENIALGLWFRANAAVQALGRTRSIAVLVALYVVNSLLRLGLHDLGFPLAAKVADYAWLGVCYYSYVGPGIFRRMIEKETAGVRIRDDY